MKPTLEKQAQIAFTVINAVAGAKNKINTAIAQSKKGLHQEAEAALQQSRQELALGHKEHQQLITYEAQGNSFRISLLLMHAEDQLLNAESLIFLAQEIIDLYQIILKKKGL